MLAITVHFHTILQRKTPEGLLHQLQVTVQPGTTVAGLLVLLDIRMAPEAMLLVVNGRAVEASHVLAEGDQVNLMPAISGGGILPRKMGGQRGAANYKHPFNRSPL